MVANKASTPPATGAGGPETSRDTLELFDDGSVGHWSNVYVGLFVLVALCVVVSVIVRFLMH
jgi:hypothetical protein